MTDIQCVDSINKPLLHNFAKASNLLLINNHRVFSFYKYLQPMWYFNLESTAAYPILVDWRKLSESDRALIDFDESYSDESSSLIDAAYQALVRGIIHSKPESILKVPPSAVPVSDQYRFVRKYFHPFWSVYILFLRLLTFNNPFVEIRSYFKNSRVRRVNVYSKLKTHIISRMHGEPLVSVIIPTLDRYSHLRNILMDLECQTYNNFEVIVVDQSSPYRGDFYTGWKLNLKVIRQEEKALWLARNTGIRTSLGEFVAFTEDDVRVGSDWLVGHLDCLETFSCDISSGVFYPEASHLPQHMSCYKWASQFASGNAMVRKDVFRAVGLFDRQFERMRAGDGEFGLRCYLAGLKCISNPKSSCLDVKASTGGLRQLGSWDSFRPKRIFSPRPIPSVNYLVRKYFGDQAAVRNIVINLFPSLVPYNKKRGKNATLISYLCGILILPVLLIPLIRSWMISSKMLKEGAKIDSLPNN